MNEWARSRRARDRALHKGLAYTKGAVSYGVNRIAYSTGSIKDSSSVEAVRLQPELRIRGTFSGELSHMST